MNSKFILVEDILSIYDDRFWYYIPGFNGYEVSNDGFIRSMKHYKKYPFGILIQPRKHKNGTIKYPEDPIYELSNNDNERVCLKLSQIMNLALNNIYQITGYPRRTCVTDISPRNQRIFVKKNLQNQSQFDKTLFFPKFNIIKDESDKICPIEFIDKGEY